MIGITVLQWHAEHHPGEKGNYAIVAFPYLFYVFFNISWGVGSWTYATEIFPVMYRAKGNALSTMTLWLACYIVAQVSPPIANAIGFGLYIIYSAICVIAFIFVRYAMGKLPYCYVLGGLLTDRKWKPRDAPSKRCLHCLVLRALLPGEVGWGSIPRMGLFSTMKLRLMMIDVSCKSVEQALLGCME